jgi:hypothetical protein
MKGGRSSTCGAPGGPTKASMINHPGWGLVKQVSDTLHGATGFGNAANWRNGPTATCMMSGCPGATSLWKSRNPSGGLE